MKQMVCSVCSFTYDEAKGLPESHIPPGTKWEDLPEDWKCPWCGAGKDAFREKQETPAPDPAAKANAAAPSEKQEKKQLHPQKELSAMELSVICSNLARGCEKQYLPEQEACFRRLAEFFRSKASPAEGADLKKLLELVEKDLSSYYPYGNQTASEKADRGALRALVWSEKVTRMLQSLLARYEAEGKQMLENTGVFLCSVCGFIYVGEKPPEICPVCKVPAWKFEKIEGRS